MRVRTNNVPRPVINGWELTPEERGEFDYLNWEAIERGEDSRQFFRYRGTLYDLREFSRIIPPGSVRRHPTESDNPALQGWDGYMTDSFFSGIVFRYVRDDMGPDYDRVICGLMLS